MGDRKFLDRSFWAEHWIAIIVFGFVLVFVAPIIDLFGGTITVKIYSVAFGFWLLAGLIILWIANGINQRMSPLQKPLQFSATTDTANHPEGIKIAGIEWHPWYRDVRLLILNDNDEDCRNVDFVVRPDAAVIGAGTEFDLPNGNFTWAGDPSVNMQYVGDKPEQRSAVPIELLATELGMRFRCDAIPSRSRVEILLPAVTIAPPEKESQQHGFDAAANDPNYWLCTTFDKGLRAWFAKPNHTSAVFAKPPTVHFVFVSGTYKLNDSKTAVSETLKVLDTVGDIIPTIKADISKRQSGTRTPVQNRARFGIEDAPVGEIKPEQRPIISAKFKNFGMIPALLTAGAAMPFFKDANQDIADDVIQIAEMAKKTTNQTIVPPGISMDFVIGEGGPDKNITLSGGQIISERSMALIDSGERILYLVYVFSYTDENKGEYTTQLCFEYDPKRKVFKSYDQYNKME